MTQASRIYISAPADSKLSPQQLDIKRAIVRAIENEGLRLRNSFEAEFRRQWRGVSPRPRRSCLERRFHSGAQSPERPAPFQAPPVLTEMPLIAIPIYDLTTRMKP
jgi:hypothetical protein